MSFFPSAQPAETLEYSEEGFVSLLFLSKDELCFHFSITNQDTSMCVLILCKQPLVGPQDPGSRVHMGVNV